MGEEAGWRLVIALGGNALLRRSDPMTTEVPRGNIKIAAQAIASLAAGHTVVIVRGNGPRWARDPAGTAQPGSRVW